jgi:anti-anti-sigma factor
MMVIKMLMTSVIAERRLIIPGLIERVVEACEFVVDAATTAGLDERGVYHCQMAVDEWCTNVIEHGYQYNGQQGQVEITCAQHGTQFLIRVRDDGPPFDPTTLSDVDPTKPLEEREPGGLGWFFIRKMMDKVMYEYKEGRNTLTMVKHGAQPANSKPLTEGPYPVTEAAGGVRVLTLNGRLDSTTSRQLEAVLTAQLMAGYALLVLDMGDVSYVSSSGLKAILTTQRQAIRQGGNLALARLSPRVLEIFQISGFDSLFFIMQSVEDAVGRITTSA